MSLLFNTIPTITELSTLQDVKTTLFHPDLTFAAKDFIVEGLSVEKVSFPQLRIINGSIINKSNILEEIELPEMVEGGYRDQGDNRVRTLLLDKVRVLHELDLTGEKTNLNKVSLQSIEYCVGIRLPEKSPNLKTFIFGPNLKQYGKNYRDGFITATNCLDQLSINNILMSFAALDGTNGTVEFANRMVVLTGNAATPGIRGLAAIKVLQRRGCTVITN